MTEPAYATVNRALTKTRSNAMTQTGGSALFLVGLPLSSGGYPTWVIVLSVINALIGFYLGRRWWRLRKSGPISDALLKTPTAITEIRGMPQKLPKGRLPIFIDIHTKNGAKGTLLLDTRKPAEVAQLAAALKARSPDALYFLDNVPLPEPAASENSPVA
ncbi:MAG TPA: hypothetical protein VIV11_36515 [Kofleriaceae bacterium]